MTGRTVLLDARYKGIILAILLMYRFIATVCIRNRRLLPLYT